MRKKIFLGLGVVLFLILALVYYGIWHNQREIHELILYGNVDVRQVDIGFRISGKVDTLCFEEGDLVRKGDLMATLDLTPYNSQYEQALANKSAIAQSLANAEILLKRREELISIQGVSQEDVDNAQTNRNTLIANLASSEAALSIAKDNLNYTKAFAPNEGIVLTRIREPGSVVNPTDPVYTLSLTTPVWIRAYISEPDLGKICFGMEVTISTDNKEAPTYHGRVGFISPIAEFTPKTVETQSLRTDLVYRLRIYIDHPDSLLKQGMPVTIRIRV